MAQKAFRLDQLPAEMRQKIQQNPGWLPVVSQDGQVLGMQNPKFGRTEMLVMCKTDETGNPTETLFTLMARENGAIDETTGFGTPSVFITPVRFDKNGDLMVGTIEENRPMIRARYLLRENGEYLDHLGVLNHVGTLLPGDVVQELASPIKDRGGELANRILYRWGVKVKFGVPGGYGAKGLSDLESAAREVQEESGIFSEPAIVWESSMDRAWAPVMDFYGFVLVRDESEIGEANLGEHEEIISKLAWTHPDEVDWRVSPDNHVLVSVFSTLFHFGLIGRTPKIRPWNQDATWWKNHQKLKNQS